MKTKDFYDGVCEGCGNTGLAGEKCLVCGGVLSKIESEDADPLTQNENESTEPEVYPLEAIDDEVKGEQSEENLNLTND